MTVDEISRFAASGRKPDGMTTLEEVLFYRLRDIYADARAGRVTNQEGAERKKMELLYHQGKLEQEQRRNKIIALYAGAERRGNDDGKAERGNCDT